MGWLFGTDMICLLFLSKARPYYTSSRYDLCPIPFSNFKWRQISTLLVLLVVIWLEVFACRLWSTGWGNKEGQWVGTIDRVCRLISSCAGNTPISSNGVLRYFISPSNGPLLSTAAFLRMRFVDCTALSPALFDCGHSSELIAWLSLLSSANFLNSFLNKCLMLVCWGPLSLTNFFGIPNFAKIDGTLVVFWRSKVYFRVLRIEGSN